MEKILLMWDKINQTNDAITHVYCDECNQDKPILYQPYYWDKKNKLQGNDAVLCYHCMEKRYPKHKFLY